ncbi:MAG: hypothetical protein ACOYOP_10825 [Microthrixaceae bacterium]
MAVTTFWSVKGGTGTTVVAAVAGAVLARRSPTLLVDRRGDLPAVLGIEEPSGPGVAEWLASPDSPPEALARLETAVKERLWLLPAGTGGPPAPAREEHLAERLVRERREVVVDLGVPTADDADPPGRSLLVVRPCYLALRRARRTDRRIDGVVVVRDGGRSLDARDAAATLNRPLVASVEVDPAVARAVDSGMLLRRPPGSIGRVVGRLW